MQILRSTKPDELQALMKGQYIELLPGAYQGHCGTTQSIFFKEEEFGFFEPLIERHFPVYSHYAFTEVPKSVWRKIIADLGIWSEKLPYWTDEQIRKNVGFIFQNSEENFFRNAVDNKAQLKILTNQFVEWLREKLVDYESLTILGV